MNASQLIITIILVVVVGAGVAVISTINQPDMSKYDAEIARLKADIERSNAKLEKKNSELEESILGVSKKATLYAATGPLKQRMTTLEDKVAELDKKLKERPVVSAAPQPAKSEIDTLIKDLAKDPEKAAKKFMESDMGKNLVTITKRNLMTRFKSRLNLDDYQTEKVKALVDSTAKKMMEGMGSIQGKSFEEQKKEGDEVFEEFKVSMREILNDEQYEKFDKMMKQGGGFGMGMGRGPFGPGRGRTPRGESDE